MERPATLHQLCCGFLAISLALSACAHAPRAMPAKSAATMVDDADPATEPALRPEDVGQRFLKLIERLHAREPLSLGAFAEAMGVPVAWMEPRHNGFSTSVAIDDRWSYALELWQESASGPWVAINLQFDHADDHEHADFSPVCGISLAAYREAFKASGYSEALDRDASGGLLAVAYATDRMFIVLTPGMKVSDEASSPSCVRRIELMNQAKPG